MAVEILAQAAAVVLPGEEGNPRSAWLAGIDGAQFERPLVAGDRLLARAQLEGRFGRLVKARGELRDERSGTLVASASLLLAMDG